MIISRTPLRVSFCGGGTDLSAFYREEPGAVVSTAINKYIYITVNRKFDNKLRASYSVTEMVDRAADLQNELIRETLSVVGIDGGIEITSISDIPSSGTGLGSSSTYTVGLLNALYAYAGKHVGPERLAVEACKVELELLGKPIGKQDQYCAAYGGFQYIQFNSDGTVFVDPIICKSHTRLELESRLLMLYTGLTRSADSILKQQVENMMAQGSAIHALRQMKFQADLARDALQQDRLDDFGDLLHEGWMLKRSLARGISSQSIDAWYQVARSHGALGGKILGAGGGGFLLLYAHADLHDSIAAALPQLKRVQFQFAPQGSKIIFVEEGPHL